MSRVCVIAEAGVNHNGDLALAKKLVDAAADAGADIVKFQTFSADRLVVRNLAKADYQAAAEPGNETQYAMLKRLELTPDMHHALLAHCAARRVGLMSTAFDIEAADFLRSLGQKSFKIPSGEITNLPYLRRIGGFGGDVILSTGMATMNEIGAALDVLEKAGTPRGRITVLHCTTEYPTPMTEVNLRAMQAIAGEFGVAVGYSDHTRGIEVAVAAVAIGATVIEKHFTLDRDLPGPDHQASLDPAELTAMVVAVRNIEIALGDGIKAPTPSEERNIPVVRRSLVAARAIIAGERFSPDNVDCKRPATGISPMRWDEVIGRQARRDFAPDELIEL